MTVREIAEAYPISGGGLRKAIQKGYVPARVGWVQNPKSGATRAYYVRRQDVEAYLQGGKGAVGR